MATNIFKLVGSIYVDNAEANKNIEDTGKKAEQTGSKMSKAVGTAVKWGAGLATSAVGASTALFGVATASAQSLDAVQKGAQKLGLSYEAYQKLSYACDRSGASIDNLSKGMKNITKDIADVANGNEKASASYDALGVSLKNTDGTMKSAEEVMQESLLALADMEDATQRNALAQEIFGNGYTELLPLLNAGSEGILELTQNAEDLGLVMSDEAVDAGAKFGDSLADVKDSLGAVVTKIGADLLPIIQNVLSWVQEHTPEIQAFLQGLFDFVSGVVDKVGEIASGLFDELADIWTEDLQPLFETLMKFVKDTFYPAIKNVLKLIAPFVKSIYKSLKDIFGDVIDVFKSVINFLDAVFRGDWEAVWNAIVDFTRGIARTIEDILYAPVKLLKTAVDWISGEDSGGYDSRGGVTTTSGSRVTTGTGKSPFMADGGIVARGGTAIVGEAGAELLSLPQGATVTPLNDRNNAFTETNKKLDSLVAIMSQLLNKSAQPMGVYINGGALVGEIAPEMDATLGRYASATARGV